VRIDLRAILRHLRHSAALIGLLTLLAVAGVAAFPHLRVLGEEWLLERLTRNAVEAVDELEIDGDPAGAQRATALDPATLPPERARMALWLAKRYRVAPEPVAALVAEAFRIGPKLELSPTLLLAVAAVESNFHPYIQSEAGAQGLMQIMSKVHRRRIDAEGGPFAVFDPITNFRIGAKILHDCVKLMGGSAESGLRFYLGGARVDDEASNGYLARINEIKQPLDEMAASAKAK